jgi:hypothetical protein
MQSVMSGIPDIRVQRLLDRRIFGAPVFLLPVKSPHLP